MRDAPVPALVLSDVDGTLIRSDKSLSDVVVAAAKRLEAAGLALSIISARPPSGMLWIARRLGLSGPMGAFNGGTIVRADGTILSAARLALEVARRTLAMVERPDVHVWLFSDGRWHCTRLGSAHDDSERVTSTQEPVVVGDFAPLLGSVDKIVVVSDDHAMLARLETAVADALGSDATVARSQPYYLDITAPAANKGDGVAALAAAMGVSLERVAVIGDQRNDMPMFARAGLSIAMAQGPAEVRATAMRVTGSNDEDGVAQAIDRIILPMVDEQ